MFYFSGTLQDKIVNSLDESMYEFFDVVNGKISHFNNFSKIILDDITLYEAITNKDRLTVLEKINYYAPSLEMAYIEIIDENGNYYTDSNFSVDARLTLEEISVIDNDLSEDSKVYFFHRDDGFYIKYAARGTSRIGTLFEGLVVFTFSFDRDGLFIDHLKNVIQKEIFIILDNNVIASTFFDFDKMQRTFDIAYPDNILKIVDDEEMFFQNKLDITGDKYSIRYERLLLNRGATNCVVGLAASRNEISEFIINNVIFTLIASFLIFLLITILSYFIAYRITRPIELLTNAAKRNATGEFVTVDIDIKNEIGDFIDNFNKMVSELKGTQNILEERVKKRTADLQESYEKLKREYESNKAELTLAKKVQQSILPDIFPENNHISIFSRYYPMEDLGGDFYDIFKISDKKIAVLILDVSGHGVPAALITTMAKISFQSYFTKFDSTKKIVTNVNDDLSRIIGSLTEYLTAFLCIIDIEAKNLNYTNAGHSTGYIIRSTENNILPLEGNSPFIAVMPQLQYEEQNIKLIAGDRIVLYTDGITETQNKNYELFGDERFMKLLIDCNEMKCDKLFDKVFESVYLFREGKSVKDDMAIIGIDIK